MQGAQSDRAGVRLRAGWCGPHRDGCRCCWSGSGLRISAVRRHRMIATAAGCGCDGVCAGGGAPGQRGQGARGQVLKMLALLPAQ